MTRKTDLHICQGRVTGLYYRDNVMAPIFHTLYLYHGHRLIFRDDNIWTHWAWVVIEYSPMVGNEPRLIYHQTPMGYP